VLALSVSALPACTYDPHPADGTLACSSPSSSSPGQRECPQGYFCDLTLGTCFAGSATGSGSTGTGGASGTGGAGGVTTGTGGATSSGQVSGTASDYLGTWVFGLVATSENSCSDGKNTTTLLGDKPAEMLTVTAGAAGGAALTTDWLCTPTNLDLDSGGAHLAAGVNKCTATYPGNDPLRSIWTASRYELTVRMNDKTNATLVADYTRVDTYADAHLVTCTQKVRAPLHKQ
jgi:hypothetical protein